MAGRLFGCPIFVELRANTRRSRFRGFSVSPLIVASAAILVLATGSIAAAEEITLSEKLEMGRSNWSTDDTRREILFIALAAVDWYQTSYGLAKKENFRESNPLLGTKPTQGEINVVIGLGVLAHVLVAYVLPPKWRRDFQIVTIGIEGYVVTTNHFILRSDP